MNPDCNPIEQQLRQDFLEMLYQKDERSNSKDHPLYARYTGLFQQHEGRDD